MKKIVYLFLYCITFFVPKNKFKYLKKNLSRISGTLDQIYCSHSCFSTVEIKDIKFDLFLKKNNSQAHMVYKNLRDENKIYELGQITCLKNIYNQIEEPIFADIGSFVGYFAFYFTLLDQQKNNVFAIESNKDHVDSIIKGIKKNNFSKIKILNKILSNQKTKLLIADELTIDPKKFDHIKNNKNEDLLLDDLSKINSEKKFYLDDSTTLDDVFIDKFPNILKIDVHGAEGLVLDGADNLLKNHVKYIILELHAESYLERYSPGFSKNKIIVNLIDKGFSCYYIGDNNIKDFNKEKISDCIKIYNNEKKMKFISINKDNINDIFFGKEKEEQFILCMKKEISIKDIKCF